MEQLFPCPIPPPTSVPSGGLNQHHQTASRSLKSVAKLHFIVTVHEKGSSAQEEGKLTVTESNEFAGNRSHVNILVRIVAQEALWVGNLHTYLQAITKYLAYRTTQL